MKKLILAHGKNGKVIALRVSHSRGGGLSKKAHDEVNHALNSEWDSVIYLENVLTLGTDAKEKIKNIGKIFGNNW